MEVIITILLSILAAPAFSHDGTGMEISTIPKTIDRVKFKVGMAMIDVRLRLNLNKTRTVGLLHSSIRRKTLRMRFYRTRFSVVAEAEGKLVTLIAENEHWLFNKCAEISLQYRCCSSCNPATKTHNEFHVVKAPEIRDVD